MFARCVKPASAATARTAALSAFDMVLFFGFEPIIVEARKRIGHLGRLLLLVLAQQIHDLFDEGASVSCSCLQTSAAMLDLIAKSCSN